MSNEVRDKLAGFERWKWYPETRVWQHDDASEGQVHHPIPDDLTACAKAWDEHAGSKEAGEWRWLRREQVWFAFKPNSGTDYVYTNNTGDDAASELRDRWELLGMVLKARGVM